MNTDQKWTFMELEPVIAWKTWLPPLFPVPKNEADRFKEDIPPLDQVLDWAQSFSRENPQHPLALELVPFMKKAPLWLSISPLLMRKEEGAAIPALKKILEIDPQEPSAHMYMGGALLTSRHDPQGALTHFNQAEYAFKDEGLFYLNRAMAYEALQEFEKALDDYYRTLDFIPADPFVLEQLGRLVETMKFHEGPSGDPESLHPLSRLAHELGGSLLAREVGLAMAAPGTYLEKFRQRMAEIGIEKTTPDLAWFALTEGLTAYKRAIEIDWREDAGEILTLLQPLTGEAGYLALVETAKDPAYWESPASEALERIGKALARTGLALFHLDKQSDSYVVVVVPLDKAAQIVQLLQAASRNSTMFI